MTDACQFHRHGCNIEVLCDKSAKPAEPFFAFHRRHAIVQAYGILIKDFEPLLDLARLKWCYVIGVDCMLSLRQCPFFGLRDGDVVLHIICF